MKLRVHDFIPFTRVEGPGERACIQVQGCPVRCSGCAVPFMWPETGGKIVEITELFRKIMDGPPVEGVTFLGGEPFAQAAALADLGRELKSKGLSVVTFSGYRIEEIQEAKRDDYDSLLAVTDLFIDGPFVSELFDTSRPWVGSSNQRYHFLTDRYRHLEVELNTIKNKIEVRIRPDGRILINGMADIDDISQLLEHL